MLYHVIYDARDGVRQYCAEPVTYRVAEHYLNVFKNLYLESDGSGKMYPNGKGRYQFSSPRIVPAQTD